MQEFAAKAKIRLNDIRKDTIERVNRVREEKNDLEIRKNYRNGSNSYDT